MSNQNQEQERKEQQLIDILKRMEAERPSYAQTLIINLASRTIVNVIDYSVRTATVIATLKLTGII